MQSPDHINLADFPLLTDENEWSEDTYLNQVELNQICNDRRFGFDKNPEFWEVFYHAKYFPIEYQECDRITAHANSGRNRGHSLPCG